MSENENINPIDQNEKSTGLQGDFYEIRVKGQLNESWSDWFEGLEMKLLDNSEMMLVGFLRDEAALMGILNKLYRLNLALLSIVKNEKR